MRFLRTLSKILILIPIAMFLYDLIKEWFVDARFKIRTLEEWWRWIDSTSLSNGRPFLEKIFSPAFVSDMMATAGPLVMLVPPVVLYVIYRIIFAIRGGHGAGHITFRSHD